MGKSALICCTDGSATGGRCVFILETLILHATLYACVAPDQTYKAHAFVSGASCRRVM